MRGLNRVLDDLNEDIFAIASAFAEFRTPTLKEDGEMTFAQLMSEYLRDVEDKLEQLSKGLVIIKKDRSAAADQWEIGVKEPGLRFILATKDSRRTLKMWIPPTSRTVFFGTLIELDNLVSSSRSTAKKEVVEPTASRAGSLRNTKSPIRNEGSRELQGNLSLRSRTSSSSSNYESPKSSPTPEKVARSRRSSILGSRSVSKEETDLPL
eukprot:TRINITY_DN10064_c0_g1_i1.p1 TRINITY_DN10064_c0_g1~~TRINITY_DN10064_c0_g1_i1.p1  ORF type:complete len:209 (-),score=40.19 TRINITY_DN10064_c0_g1_i1:25-651(-)